MLAALRRRRDPELKDDEGGFTLIELMVVVLIIAILIAIAIPTFFGAQEKAKRSAAQSNLRNAISSIKVMAADYEGQFLGPDGTTKATMADLAAVERSIKWVDGTSASPKAGQVAVSIPSTAELRMWAQVKSDEFYAVKISDTGAIGYCKGTESGVKGSTCDADSWETSSTASSTPTTA